MRSGTEGQNDGTHGDETHNGEDYFLIRTTGVYDIAMSAGGTDGKSAFASVQFYADPKPTVLQLGVLPATAHTETLNTIGDTLLVYLDPGTKQGGEWTIAGAVGAGTTCDTVYSIAGPTGTGIDNLGPACGHRTDFGEGPNSTPATLVIFNRTGTPETVTVTPTK